MVLVFVLTVLGGAATGGAFIGVGAALLGLGRVWLGLGAAWFGMSGAWLGLGSVLLPAIACAPGASEPGAGSAARTGATSLIAAVALAARALSLNICHILFFSSFGISTLRSAPVCSQQL